ncbi:hypothetical protein Drose_25775 [Dactylosporangium roseum]|uniref:Uncharacterized protein n=1 Tax=Dactylosporangium roseum TaxID=47989 RepID=A0ABY5Z0K9_9ACTN|nr:hypothetical protein [Dactylosporangium roseum]UWZ34618.1 hypothetical protein Drose_25775 [Dactylosporangium roseum]
MTEVDIAPGAQAAAEQLRTQTAAHGDAIVRQLANIAGCPVIVGDEEVGRMVAEGIEAARPLADVTGKFANAVEQDGTIGEISVGRLLESDRRSSFTLRT